MSTIQVVPAPDPSITTVALQPTASLHPSPLARTRDEDASRPCRKRARPDEDLDSAIAFPAEHAANRGAFACLKEDAGEDGPNHGRDALEDSGAREREPSVLGLAPRAVGRGPWPCRGETPALQCVPEVSRGRSTS